MPLLPYKGKMPRVGENVYLAPTAVLIGDVEVHDGANIWFGAVLRGDFGRIVVERNASVQDNVVVHVLPGGETIIGEEATIAHGAVLHNCRIGRGAVIGMNAVVLDHAVVGEEAMIAAGSVVSTGQHIPPRVLAAGAPAAVKKELAGESLNWVKISAASYQQLRDDYLKEEGEK